MKYLNSETVTYIVEWVDCMTHFRNKDVAEGYAEEKRRLKRMVVIL